MRHLPRRSASLRALFTFVPALLASVVAPTVFAGCSPDDDAPPTPDAGPVVGLDVAPVTNPDSSSSGDAAPDASPSEASPDALPDGSSSAIVQLAVGRDSSCVRRANGTVWCWGKNSYGELGRGTQTPTGTPAPVTGLTDAIDISVGNVHACAVHATGGVSCWGDGASGQLGDGTSNTDHFTPNPVIDTATGAPFADAKAVAASFAGYNCILRTSGAVVCWGQDAAGIGAYGDGTNVARNAPGTNVSGITDAIFLSKGDAHACVRLAAGGVKCWGANTNAQCTDGVASGIHSTPFTSVHAASATDITTGQLRTCWLLPGRDGSMRGQQRLWTARQRNQDLTGRKREGRAKRFGMQSGRGRNVVHTKLLGHPPRLERRPEWQHA